MEIKKGQKFENYSIISKDTLSCVCLFSQVDAIAAWWTSSFTWSIIVESHEFKN